MDTIPNELVVYIGNFLESSDIQILRNVNSRFFHLFPSHKLKMSYLIKWYLSPSIEKWLGDNGLKFNNLMYNAALGGHLEIIQWLTQKPPYWIDCTGPDCTVQLEIIKWWRSQIPYPPWNRLVCAYAAKGGHLEVLKWLRAQNPPCPWDKNRICEEAALNGNIEILDWLKSIGDDN